MKIHKEGWPTIIIVFMTLALLNAAVYYFTLSYILLGILLVLSAGFFYIILYFFRNPDRSIATPDNTKVYAPADGKIVVIEETPEDEYFKDRRIQVSIFMSPLNVHVNRYPISGEVAYYKYHPGKYLVAWHPKSSILNERSTVVVNVSNGKSILLRQIAGAVARRIVTYARAGMPARQGDDMGFIKFGSRVDVFLPLGTKINVQLNQVVKGNQTVIATF